MHYHAEIWVKELEENVKAQVESILAPYNDELEIEQIQDGNDHYWINPQGFWDWYQIGGRWTGEHTNFHPEDDPQNIEICFLCNGTGYRNDDIGQQTRKADSSYTCNGCGEFENGKWVHSKYGNGKRLKWPTQFAEYKGDIMPLNKVKTDLTCYTLIVGNKILRQEEWNGKDFIKTEFSGNVVDALKSMGINNGYLITVDYHT